MIDILYNKETKKMASRITRAVSQVYNSNIDLDIAFRDSKLL